MIYASDAGIHIAGDGKLAGLVLPNDGECDLGRDGYYKGAELQDYPTIEQVGDKQVANIISEILKCIMVAHSHRPYTAIILFAKYINKVVVLQ